VAAPKIDTAAWWRRIRDAEKKWAFEKPLWERLEDAVDGVYSLSSDAVANEATDMLNALKAGHLVANRLEINVIGQVYKHYLDISWDRSPSFRFKDLDTDDDDAVEALEKLVRKIAEAGKLQMAGRRAMGSSMTRGPFVLWPIVERGTVGTQELIGKSIPPAAIVELVLRNSWDGKIPLGVDCTGIVAALNQVLGNAAMLAALDEATVVNLYTLDGLARKRCADALKKPHPTGLSAKVKWLALPYGDWFLADSTVTDYSEAGWVCRKVVLTPEEFKADPTFTDEAKRTITAQPPSASDGGVPSDTGATKSENRAVEEEGRVVLREVWDLVGWQRFFLADTYDGVVSKDTTPLYMGEDGRPLFADFFPCTFRTPIQKARLTAARLTGKPLVEDMWAPQVEFIEFMSAAMRAAKNTIRVSVAGPHVDGDTLTEWKNAEDGTCIRLSKNAPPEADPTKQFTSLPMPPAPRELLVCADQALSLICAMGRVNRATVTGDPIAATATQEQISVQGASVAQGDMVRAWEDGTAESALKGLLIFLHSASPQEFESYMGAAALQPRPSKLPPMVGPDGVAVPPPPLPPIVEVIKGLNLVGAQLECRFDASTRSETALRLKQVMDAIAMANTVRDATNTPYVDLGSLVKKLFNELDIPWREWTPSKSEMQAMMNPSPGGEDGEDGDGEDGDEKPGKPQADSRKANGQRGTPASPGRQSRHRKPDNEGSMNGHQIRRATATS